MTNSPTILVVIASLVALLAVSTEGTGSIHVAFANRGINVQKDTSQDQVCEPAGGTSGITNACTATSMSGPMQVALSFQVCAQAGINPFTFECITPVAPDFCNNIGCQSITCVGPINNANCTTNNGVQLASCTVPGTAPIIVSCTRTVSGTGISSSGGVTGGDG